MKRTIASLVAVGLAAMALVATSGMATAAPKAVVVGTDPAGDWGAAVDPNIGPIGNAMGQDLVEASIGMADKATVNFVIKVNSLPPAGGMPEFTRYTWNFTVGEQALELDGKFTNYSRGTCDPTSKQCPPPRDPGMQPFLLRGNCGPNDLVVTTFTICEELAKIQAVFDAGAGTITIPVPLAAMGAKAGSKIVAGPNIFGGTISAAPSAWATSSAMPMDTLAVAKSFTVPRK